jgi:hypothetical protein
MIILTTFLILGSVPSAGAQPAEKNELTVFGGMSLLDITTTERRNPYILETSRGLRPLIFPPPFLTTSRSLGASGEFGVRYGRDLTEAVTFVGDFAIAPGHELTDEVSYGCPEPLVCIAGPGGLVAPNVQFFERVVAYHYGGGLQMNIRRGRLTPSVIAGLGGVTYATPIGGQSQFTFRFGGRVAAAAGRLTTSIEVLDAIVTDHFVTNRVEHDVHARIGVGVGF